MVCIYTNGTNALLCCENTFLECAINIFFHFLLNHSYKSTFERLKGLKTEIDHLQHLLQRSKIKLQKDFEDWWTQETARLQVRY